MTRGSRVVRHEYETLRPGRRPLVEEFFTNVEDDYDDEEDEIEDDHCYCYLKGGCK